MSIQHFKTITPHPPDINFLLIHYHPILQHLTKLSLNIKNIRNFKVICHFVKKLVHANSTFKPCINSNEHAYLQFFVADLCCLEQSDVRVCSDKFTQ